MQKLLTIENIRADIIKAHEKEGARLQSWEYCYAFFRNYKDYREDKEWLDKAALHLGFFLASWGMLRGSTFLLQLNYTYYKHVIEVLLDQKYDALWDIRWNIDAPEKHIDLLFELVKHLTQIMEEKSGFENRKPTDTLITKIIMATMGCVPAYDTYFTSGLKIFLEKRGGKLSNSFTKASFAELLSLSRTDAELCKIYDVSIPTVIPGVNYTPMKLLDAYFWQVYDDLNPSK